MNNRKIVSMDTLSEWLTTHVSNHEDCEGTNVSVQYKLLSPDSNGCNWSESVILNPGPNADKQMLMTILANAVRDAREKFNVE